MAVQPIAVQVGELRLDGDLSVPAGVRAVVCFAHGTGSSRHSPRNRAVARRLQDDRLATLLLDLLSAEEESEDLRTRQLRFDIDLLAGRLVAAIDWLAGDPRTQGLPLGLFGASTGAAAALVAAARRPAGCRAVVSRGGRPDLAGPALSEVRAPTLLVVGGRDREVLALNRAAAGAIGAPVEVAVVPGAGHLFEEPGTLERVGELAADWFGRHLRGPARAYSS